MQPHQLADPADEVGDLLAETRIYLLCGLCIDDGQLEQQAGNPGLRIGPERCQRHCDIFGKYEGVLPGGDRVAGIERTDEFQRFEDPYAVGLIQAGHQLHCRFVVRCCNRYHEP
jgi:hypothetical protein